MGINITKIKKINPEQVKTDCVHGKYGYCTVKTVSEKYPCNEKCPARKI